MLHILPRQNYQRGTKSSNTGACGGHSTSKPQWTLGSRGQQQAGGENKLTGGFPAEGGRHGQDPELPEEDGGREAGSYSWALRETDRHVSMLEKQLFLRERNRERAKNGGGGEYWICGGPFIQQLLSSSGDQAEERARDNYLRMISQGNKRCKLELG